MTQPFIWILILLTCVLFMAGFTAMAARRESIWSRVGLLSIGWYLPAILLLALAAGGITAAIFLPIYKAMGWGTALLFASFVVITLFTRWHGFRRDALGVRIASIWSPARLLAGSLMSFLLLVLVIWNMDLQAQLRLSAYRAQASALLLSVAPPQVPDSQNAALVYQEAFETFRGNKSLRDEIGNAKAGTPEAEELLKKLNRELQIIRRATEMPDCRFDMDYSQASIALALPDLSDCRTAATLLSLSSLHSARQGNIDAALAEVNRVYRLSDHVGSNPMLVGHLVSIGITALADEKLSEILPKVTSANQLELIQLPMKSSVRRRASAALRGEIAFGSTLICDFATGEVGIDQLHAGATGRTGETNWAYRNIVLPPLRVFMVDRDLDYYRRTLHRVVELSQEPLYTATPDELSSTRIHADAGLFGRVVVPSLDRYLQVVSRAEAMRDIRALALAATRYRLEQGQYPQTLDALVPTYLPAVPTDPFAGQPIRMLPIEGGIAIYSVGEDKQDNKGLFEPEKARDPKDYGMAITDRPKVEEPAVEQ